MNSVSDTATIPPVVEASSAAMRGALALLRHAIKDTGGVLLCGEPGTGRETFARAIHAGRVEGIDGERLTQNGNGPFIVVDCEAPADFDQQIFGCVQGPIRLTEDGIDRFAEGSKLHAALGGVLFFRHIARLPAPIQERLARTLRAGEAWLLTPQGSSRRTLNIRAIASSPAATLGAEIQPELAQRFGQTVIQLPPLRERREEIPSLVRALLIDVCAGANLPLKKASSPAMALLQALPWRGNIRELRGLLRTIAVRVPDSTIRLRDVLAHVTLEGGANSVAYAGSLRQARERFEREYVAFVLEQHRGRMAEAAKVLGIQRTNLYRKVRQLSVPRSRSERTSS